MLHCDCENRVSQPNRKNRNRPQLKGKQKKTACSKGRQAPVNNRMSSLISFYHYTSDWGMDGIIESGMIRNSSHGNNHAHFGEGAYGTSLPPSEGQQAISRNNWTRHGHFYIINGKVSHAIEVRIPVNKVERVGGHRRDILVHLDGPIYLKDYEWKAWTVPEDCIEDPVLLRSGSPRHRPQTAPSTRAFHQSRSASSMLQSVTRPTRVTGASGSMHTTSSFASSPTYSPASTSVPISPSTNRSYAYESGSAAASQQYRTPTYSYKPRNSYDYSADTASRKDDSLCTIL